ncbi:hypothetical protein VPH35_065907 [Triticum aestivum]
MKAMFCSKSQRLPTIARDCDDGPLSSFALLFLLICKSRGREGMLDAAAQNYYYLILSRLREAAHVPAPAVRPGREAPATPPGLRNTSAEEPILRRIGLGIIGYALEHQPPPVHLGPPPHMPAY